MTSTEVLRTTPIIFNAAKALEKCIGEKTAELNCMRKQYEELMTAYNALCSYDTLSQED